MKRDTVKALSMIQQLQQIPCPVRLEMAEKNASIEIQYFIALGAGLEFADNAELRRFAVTTDGWDLFVDPRSEHNEVMQLEVDDLDSISVTISDLLLATRKPL